jgi:8-oxo-dGTP diphosphatase
MGTEKQAMEGPSITKFVMGFMFTDENVILLEKRRPERFAGLLNAPGGHVEEGESPQSAVAREFREETGIETSTDLWREVTAIHGDDYSLHLFACFHPHDQMRTVTDEEVWSINFFNLNMYNCVPDMLWMVPLARQVLRGDYSVTSVLDTGTRYKRS